VRLEFLYCTCSAYGVGLGVSGGLSYYGQIYNPPFFLIMLAGGQPPFERFYDPAAHQAPIFYKTYAHAKAGIAVAFGLGGNHIFWSWAGVSRLFVTVCGFEGWSPTDQKM
jgi:hypothetical protein